MKKALKHLAWILPAVLVILVISLAIYAARARTNDNTYHSPLTKSLQVSSSSFQNEQEMPVEFSCRGAGASPDIKWLGLPNARSYALITMDWDAPSPSLRLFPIVHWVLYNIPADVTEIVEKATPADLKNMNAGVNVAGVAAYAPPCPPLGQHRYEFRVYALDLERIQPVSNSRADVMKAMAGHVVAYGELVGLKSPG